MASTEIVREIEELRAEIERHNRLYYVLAAPEISDREFDRLMDRLQRLEAEHPELITPESPTRKVGGEPLGEFQTVQHSVPMLSIENTYNFNEVREWDQRVRKGLNPGDHVHYAVELKVDGVAVSLRYEHGKLALGATRGDGERGDDITANLRTVRNIPLQLAANSPPLVEVRGEVYMTNAELIRLNELRREADETLFANPRNATAGSLKMLDPKLCGKRRLLFVAHGLGESQGVEAATYTETLARLKALGIPISPWNARFESIEEVIEHARRWEHQRNSLDFQTDGLVVKVDDLGQRARLGARTKSPRWVIAFKYEAEQAITRIESVSVQVGKTGKVTPVAELSPVTLAGTVVKRATLHNIEEIRRKDIRVGDTVVIQKAGEIIPQVMRVEVAARSGAEEEFQFPTHCPSCGAALVREPEEVDFRCPTPAYRCPDQLKEWVRWFAHRDAMDIDGLGEKLIVQLVDKNLIKNPADLYRLRVEDLSALERMGVKSANNLVAAIDASKTRSLDRLITALTIRHVGTSSAESLAARFGTIEALRAAGIEQLLGVPDIGPIVAASVHDFFQTADNQALLDELVAVGVRPTPLAAPSAAAHGSLPLQGMTFVLTGTLPKRSRGDAEKLIKQLGGKVTGSVSKSTSFVLAGEEAGSKLDKARQLNIPVIDETELERIAGVLEP